MKTSTKWMETAIKKALRNWARPEIPYQYQQYTGRE